tara:strand:- start:164 stop:283 length:120 start_codon:yes stop_codon:yes gene_type:complete
MKEGEMVRGEGARRERGECERIRFFVFVPLTFMTKLILL